jgi:TRAP-type C4-dicarboxylate transport system substrate-binding protein
MQHARGNVDNLRTPVVGSQPSARGWIAGRAQVHAKKKGGFVKGLSRSLFAVVGAAAIAGGLAACGDSDSGSSTTSSSTSTAATAAEVTIRVGYVTTPQHPYGISIGKFKAAVETASGGKIAINPIAGASGANDVALLGDVSSGAIEAAAVSTAVWGSQGVKVFQPLQAAFLISNYPLSETVLGGPIGQAMLADPNGPPKLGLVGLGILEGGIRKPMGAKAALVSTATIKGKKWRAPLSDNMVASLKAMGASPLAIPLADVSPALKNGQIDALDTNYGLAVTQKWYENAKYLTNDLNLWPFPAALVVNKAAFDKLTSDQQAALTTAGQNLAKDSIEGVYINPPAGATNFLKVLCDNGVIIATAGDANKKALAAAAQPATDALAADPVTSGYLKQIQDAKAAQAPLPAPPPLPDSCKTQ